jgi:hypothetical protein
MLHVRQRSGDLRANGTKLLPFLAESIGFFTILAFPHPSLRAFVFFLQAKGIGLHPRSRSQTPLHPFPHLEKEEVHEHSQRDREAVASSKQSNANNLNSRVVPLRIAQTMIFSFIPDHFTHRNSNPQKRTILVLVQTVGSVLNESFMCAANNPSSTRVWINCHCLPLSILHQNQLHLNGRPFVARHKLNDDACVIEIHVSQRCRSVLNKGPPRIESKSFIQRANRLIPDRIQIDRREDFLELREPEIVDEKKDGLAGFALDEKSWAADFLRVVR